MDSPLGQRRHIGGHVGGAEGEACERVTLGKDVVDGTHGVLTADEYGNGVADMPCECNCDVERESAANGDAIKHGGGVHEVDVVDVNDA